MRLVVAVVVAALGLTAAAQVNPDLYAGLQWRSIGPLRSGRISAVTGVPGQPGVFYVGLPGGGVWKTVSAGATWFPVFDGITSVSSIGAVEVAPSDPNVVYAGTGDLITGGAINEGDGMYRSSDAGKTWQHIGLADSYQIPAILVDPHDPNLVLVAAQGNVHAQTGQGRGIFRSTDGGKNWTRVFFKDDVTGVQSLAWAYDDPNVILATTDRHFTAPGGRGAGGGGGRGGAAAADPSVGVYLSTDEGATWKEVTGGGLPALSGRTAVAVAAHTGGKRMFLVGSFGLYRSDDGGASWEKSTTDRRVVGSGYICNVYVDTANPDIVYTMNTSMYQSTDGGHTFIALKGAPGGDDNHVLWIDPANHQRLLMGSDQGATISFDGGHTWSLWWNLPNAQVYHISADTRFPYWVYGTQQDTGSVGTRSRGDFGEITPFDWWPVAGYEFGYIVPDPLDNNIVYAGGMGGGVVKIVAPTGMYENIAPNQGSTDYRKVTSNPIVFSPTDPGILYVATQYVVMSADRGLHWKNISPDLTVRAGAPPTDGGGGRGGAAIETLAPSPAQAGVIWTGSNNGVVELTQDNGATWHDVTPAGLPATADLSMIEASHTRPAEAYAAVDEHTSGDYRPYLYRTRDAGRSWQPIVTGLPTGERSGSFVRVVREDPIKPGLLFAGTESSVYVSFDDGDHWQSLRLNLPTTSYRDMLIHGNDLVVGTYGRSFWVLDDMSPLRQIAPGAANGATRLFRPGDAIRTRWSVMGNMPFTPEMPHAVNPPFGAILYYYLAAPPQGEIKLQIFDAQDRLVRTLSSAPIPPPTPNVQSVPDYWLQHPQPMPTAVGTNRVAWDLRYDPPPAGSRSYQATDAVYLDTPASPQGPYVMPGTYTVKLTVDGQTYAQPLVVHNDPRLGEGAAEMHTLAVQMALEQKIMVALQTAESSRAELNAARATLRGLAGAQQPPAAAQAATALDGKLAALEGASGGARRGGGGFAARGGAAATPTFSALLGSFDSLLNAVGQADMVPNQPQLAEWQADCANLNAAIGQLRALASGEVAAFNRQLAAGQAKLELETVPAAAACP